MKPRLRLEGGGFWRCFTSKTEFGRGITPKEAWDDFVYWRGFPYGP